jgi:hypothetical protein
LSSKKSVGRTATVPTAERFYDIPASDFTALNVVAPLSLS